MRTVRASQFSAVFAAASFALCATPASAAIVDSPNHSYLTDTATGLDWLDVTATAGMSFNYVSSQLGIGGQFAGWRYATGNQFNSLVSNYSGVAIAAGNYGQVNMETDRIDGLLGLMGSTLDHHYGVLFGHSYDQHWGFPEGEGLDFSYGLLADSHSLPGYQFLGIIYDSDEESGGDVTAAHRTYFHVSSAENHVGSFLVRDHIAAPVPEPETYAMLFAGLGLLGVMTRRRNQKSVA